MGKTRVHRNRNRNHKSKHTRKLRGSGLGSYLRRCFGGTCKIVPVGTNVTGLNATPVTPVTRVSYSKVVEDYLDVVHNYLKNIQINYQNLLKYSRLINIPNNILHRFKIMYNKELSSNRDNLVKFISEVVTMHDLIIRKYPNIRNLFIKLMGTIDNNNNNLNEHEVDEFIKDVDYAKKIMTEDDKNNIHKFRIEYNSLNETTTVRRINNNAPASANIAQENVRTVPKPKPADNMRLENLNQ